MSADTFSWSDEQQPSGAPHAGSQFAWSDEKDSAPKDSMSPSPITLNAKRGGSTVTEPDVKDAAVSNNADRIARGYGRSFGFMAGGGLENTAEEAAPEIIPAIKSTWNRLRGKPVYPGASLPETPAPELLQGRALEHGGHTPPEPAASLRTIPVSTPEMPAPSIRRVPGDIPPLMVRPRAYTARTAEPIPSRPGLSLPPAPEPPASVAPRAEYPPATPPRAVRLDPEPGSPEDIAETKDIQGQIRDAADAEDRNRLLAVQRDRFPQRTKFDLTNEPVKFTRTPGVSRFDGPKLGTVVPNPDEDLTPLLRRSVRAAKKAKD